MIFSRSATMLLLGFSFIAMAPAFSQTKEETEQVAAITRRPPTSSATLIFVGGIAQGKGDFKKAESCFKKVLDIYKSDPGIGPASAKYAWILSRQALCHAKLNEKAEAVKLAREALAIIDGQTPDNNPEESSFIITARQNCAVILGKEMPAAGPAKTPALTLKSIPLSDIVSLAEQERQVLEILRVSEKQNQSGESYRKNLLYLANIYTLEKKNSLAEPLFKKAIGLSEKEFGKNSPALLTPLSNYGYLLQQAGRQKDAVDILCRMQLIRDGAGNRAQIGSKP